MRGAASQPLGHATETPNATWQTRPFTSPTLHRADGRPYRWISGDRGPEWPLGAVVSLEVNVATPSGPYVIELRDLAIGGED